jgi:hypothetical protein
LGDLGIDGKTILFNNINLKEPGLESVDVIQLILNRVEWQAAINLGMNIGVP